MQNVNDAGGGDWQNTGEFGAILMHKMMFPSESCNSVSKGTFREFRTFSVIAGNRWP